MHTDAGRVTLRGFGDGRSQEELVAQWLGDRLTTAWLHSPSELLMIRNVVGRIGLALGFPALIAALVLTWLQPAGLANSTAPLIAVGGVAALLIALVPDMVMEVIWKVRGHAERPVSSTPVLRYARSSGSTPETPHIATDPMGRPRSALEAITLDLGDLPRMPEAPELVEHAGLAVVPALAALPQFEDELRLEDLGLPAEWDDLSLEDLDLPEGWQDDFPDWPEEVVDLPRAEP